VARQLDPRDYCYRDRASYDYHSMSYDKLTFECQRGRLEGTMVWYWTYRDVIVRVDV
jgi:hypothetical protein